MQIKILGCGPSLGVPVLGCECNTCTSKLLFNKRTNSAIHIQSQNTNILVDFGLDIRHQLLHNKILKLDAAILTHNHADHVGGIDGLRVYYNLTEKPLPIYAEKEVAKAIVVRHKYLFDRNFLEIREVEFEEQISINGFKIQFFRQHHGPIDSLGIKIDQFIYSCDVSSFPEASKPYLYNAKNWIVDCVNYTSSLGHSGLDKILQWNEEFKPTNIYLSNMSHVIEYEEISKKLPSNIKPLYDGFSFTT